MSHTPFPPAPWDLRGPAVVIAGSVAAEDARRRLAAPARLLALPLVGAVTALVLADYREGSTLRYSELAAIVGPAAHGLLPGGWVHTMLVDDEASRAGGRAIWNVPKELGSFEWTGDPPRGVVVRDGAGDLVVSAQWSRARLSLPMPVVAPFLGAADGGVVTGRLAGGLRGGPARASVSVPETSPLHDLGLSGTRAALVGGVRLRASGGRR